MDVTDTGPTTRLDDYRTLAVDTLSPRANATPREIELAIALQVMLGLYEQEIAAHQRSVDHLMDRWSNEYHRLKDCLVQAGITPILDSYVSTAASGRNFAPPQRWEQAGGYGLTWNSTHVALADRPEMIEEQHQTQPDGPEPRFRQDIYIYQAGQLFVTFTISQGGMAPACTVELERADEDAGNFGTPENGG